ncbi:MAG: molecular chaperone Tir [Desulfovibrio sp.]|nr:molecular chaperone Tir [Desulfovibrio sp.]
MASFLDSAASAVAAAAGWKRPEADERGIYGFSLRGDLDMRMFSPDGGGTVVFCSAVQTLPEEERARDELLLAQARRAVAACRERESTLALEGNTLVLQRVVRDKETALEELPGIAECFLNDLDWWRKQAARLAG